MVFPIHRYLTSNVPGPPLRPCPDRPAQHSFSLSCTGPIYQHDLSRPVLCTSQTLACPIRRALYVTPPQWFMAAFPLSPWQNYRPRVQDKTGENESQEQPVKQRLARTKEYSNRANFLKSKQTPKGVPCFTLFKVMGEFFTKNISNTPCLKLGDKLYNTSVLTHR